MKNPEVKHVISTVKIILLFKVILHSVYLLYIVLSFLEKYEICYFFTRPKTVFIIFITFS